MTVLYASDRATVYLGDARDVLQEIETESIDLVVTDPPYGVEWVSRLRSESFGLMAGDGSDRDGVREIVRECVRLVGQNRHLYVFGPEDVLDGLPVSERCALVWDKGVMGAGNLSAAWGPAHESITFAVSKHRHGGETGTSAVPVRRRKGTVLRFPRPTGRKVRHPSEKPVALISELVESSSRIGETILDPFGGSGSTAVAAVLLGRRIITVEVDERYAATIVDRVRNAERIREEGSAI